VAHAIGLLPGALLDSNGDASAIAAGDAGAARSGVRDRSGSAASIQRSAAAAARVGAGERLASLLL
jgi:hypothetical protein